MANLNFTTGSGSGAVNATTVETEITQTEFQNLLTGLTPQSDFFDRSIVCNESSSDSKDFKVKSATTATNSLGETKGDFALFVDTTANVGVGIGGTCYPDYELTAHGSVRIVGDATTPNTEIYVSDSSDVASIALQGTTGSYQHIRTTSGEAEIFLSTTADTVGSTNNSFNIRVSGTSTDFLIYDYDTTNGHTNGQAFLDVDNATATVGVGGAADTSYQLKVVGDTWCYGKLSIGVSGTVNPYISEFTTADTDIVSAVTSGSSLTASGFGLIVSGDPAGHIVAAVRANDEHDAFIVAVPDTVASETTNPNCDKSVFKATYNSVIINEDARDVDFRVESDTNANMLMVDGGLNAVGIGAAAVSTVTLKVAGYTDLSLSNYADDTAAGTGGVPVGGLYHASGTVKVRVT